MAVRESTKKPQTHNNPQKATRKAKISKKNIKAKQIYFRILHHILTQNQKKQYFRTLHQNRTEYSYGKPKKPKNTNFQGLFETRPSAGRVLKYVFFVFFASFGSFVLFFGFFGFPYGFSARL